MSERLYPKYKRVKLHMPHCPKCGEQLQGNNSMVSPWRCSCGVWKCNGYDDPFSYHIEKKAASEEPAA